jgi:glyoxylase-like metal-dependent hydrolase (beta-lactamase superfamily II)
MAKIAALYPHEATNVANALVALPSDGKLPFFPEWEWIETPGHAPGHVSLFRKSDGILISGDAVITVKQDSFYQVLVQKEEVNGPPVYLTTDWLAAGESVRRLAALQPKILVAGHGQVMMGIQLQQELSKLAENFNDAAVPKHGKYVPNNL